MPPEQDLLATTTTPTTETPSAPVSDANPGTPSTPDAGAKPAAASPTVETKDAKPVVKSIDITRKVVADALKPSEPSTDGKDPKTAAPGDQGDQDKDLPFHQHPRWQQVKAEVATLKQQNGELQQQAAQSKDGADRFEALTTYMGQTGLVADDVTSLLDFGAKAKSTDPKVLKECAETLISIAHSVLEGIGEMLPADLEQKVKEGLIDADTAKELAKKRGEAATATTRAQKTEDQLRTEAKTRADREVMTTIVNWENEVRGKDLRYTEKMSKLVAAECARLISEKGGQRPSNAPNAKKLMDQAYKNVLDNMGDMTPAKPAVTPSRSTSSAAPAAALSRKGLKSIDVTRAIVSGQRIAD